MINIYILKLSQGKYYIGKTDNPEKRYEEHKSGVGSSWTKKYRPICLEKIYRDASPFDEDKYTKEYMAKYGIDNVRGGSYVSIVLDDTIKDSLKKEIWAAQDKCTQCGRNGHFAKDCQAKTDVDGNEFVYIWECSKCDREFESERACIFHEISCGKQIVCFKCGKAGHYASSCYSNARSYYSSNISSSYYGSTIGYKSKKYSSYDTDSDYESD